MNDESNNPMHKIVMQMLDLTFLKIKFCISINNISYVGRHTRDIIKQLGLIMEEGEDMETKEKESHFVQKQLEIQKSGLHGIITGMFRTLGWNVRICSLFHIVNCESIRSFEIVVACSHFVTTLVSNKINGPFEEDLRIRWKRY
jgi:hypothetical protein